MFENYFGHFSTLNESVFSLLILDLVFVGYDAPVILSQGRKLPNCLQVRLVKARKHKVAVVCLKLRIQVLLLVALVDERVQANTIVAVLIKNVQRDVICAEFQVALRQVDMLIVEL